MLTCYYIFYKDKRRKRICQEKKINEYPLIYNVRNLYNKSRQVKWRIYGTCLQELYEGFKRAGM